MSASYALVTLIWSFYSHNLLSNMWRAAKMAADSAMKGTSLENAIFQSETCTNFMCNGHLETVCWENLSISS